MTVVAFTIGGAIIVLAFAALLVLALEDVEDEAPDHQFHH